MSTPQEMESMILAKMEELKLKQEQETREKELEAKRLAEEELLKTIQREAEKRLKYERIDKLLSEEKLYEAFNEMFSHDDFYTPYMGGRSVPCSKNDKSQHYSTLDNLFRLNNDIFALDNQCTLHFDKLIEVKYKSDDVMKEKIKTLCSIVSRKANEKREQEARIKAEQEKINKYKQFMLESSLEELSLKNTVLTTGDCKEEAYWKFIDRIGGFSKCPTCNKTPKIIKKFYYTAYPGDRKIEYKEGLKSFVKYCTGNNGAHGCYNTENGIIDNIQCCEYLFYPPSQTVYKVSDSSSLTHQKKFYNFGRKSEINYEEYNSVLIEHIKDIDCETLLIENRQKKQERELNEAVEVFIKQQGSVWRHDRFCYGNKNNDPRYDIQQRILYAYTGYNKEFEEKFWEYIDKNNGFSKCPNCDNKPKVMRMCEVKDPSKPLLNYTPDIYQGLFNIWVDTKYSGVSSGIIENINCCDHLYDFKTKKRYILKNKVVYMANPTALFFYNSDVYKKTSIEYIEYNSDDPYGEKAKKLADIEELKKNIEEYKEKLRVSEEKLALLNSQ